MFYKFKVAKKSFVRNKNKINKKSFKRVNQAEVKRHQVNNRGRKAGKRVNGLEQKTGRLEEWRGPDDCFLFLHSTFLNYA